MLIYFYYRQESMKVLYDKIPTEGENADKSGTGDGKKRADKSGGKAAAVFVETPIQNELDVDVSRLESNTTVEDIADAPKVVDEETTVSTE